jgi:hypothetical protein
MPWSAANMQKAIWEAAYSVVSAFKITCSQNPTNVSEGYLLFVEQCQPVPSVVGFIRDARTVTSVLITKIDEGFHIADLVTQVLVPDGNHNYNTCKKDG